MAKVAPLTSETAIKRLKPDPDKPIRRPVHSKTGLGLFIMVHPTGNRAYLARYTFDGKRFMVTLGNAGAMTLAEAQAKHAEGAALVAAGRDPRLVWSDAYQANVTAVTCGEYFSAWLAQFAQLPSRKTKRPPTAKTVNEHRARWGRSLAWLHSLPMKEVSRERVTREIRALAAKAPTEARLALQLLSLMFGAAEDDGTVTASPVAGIKAAKLGAVTGRRDRFLSLDEIRQLWAALEGPAGDAVRLLLLTGARRSEVAGMRWDELDLAAGEWRLPAERTKSRRPFLIHLGPLAVAIIERLALLRRGAYVFANRQDAKPLHPDSINTAIARHIERSKCAHFTPHDLRRSAATHWHSSCGADASTADQMLNHQLGTLAATYIVSADSQRQKAIRLKWDALLASLASGEPMTSNVVAMAGGRV